MSRLGIRRIGIAPAARLGLILGAATLIASLVPSASTQNSEVLVQRNVDVPMRDGVILRADVFRLSRTEWRRARTG